MNERVNGLVGTPERTVVHYRTTAVCEVNATAEEDEDETSFVLLLQLSEDGVNETGVRIPMWIDPVTAQEFEVGAHYSLDVAMERVYE